MAAAFALSLGILPAFAGDMTAEMKTLHVLNRLAYGPAPGDMERVSAMGAEAWIREQLNPEAVEQPEALKRILEGCGTMFLSSVALFREYGPKPDAPGGRLSGESVRRAREQAAVVLREARGARLAEAVLSRRQLLERMVAFWTNHFNVNAEKSLVHLWAGSFEREAIRPHAMGRFVDLLAAAAMHPAMLIYLDNWRNRVVREPGKPADYTGINATYAKTLLAAHTMGPDGGWTKKDVDALARIFSGWRIGSGREGTGLSFDAAFHDPRDKEFLGARIPGGGASEGARALTMLAGRPETAVHICRRLAAWFLADDPPLALVDRLVKAYMSSGGYIRSVLRELFASPEFFDDAYFHAKFKTPFFLLVSGLRAAGAVPEAPSALMGQLDDMDMRLYTNPAPAGYPDKAGRWINAKAVAARLAFAQRLGSGRLITSAGGEAAPPVDADALAGVLGGNLSKETLAAAKRQKHGAASVIFGSPDFQWR